ncbi:MAG TPA: glutamyl-tRNA reductase [Acidimicrobiales bacterium]|nr:glutamyl-tRNA reductase [Acidimicrobiales bacterium]
MSVVVVGLNHRSVPLAVLETMAVPESRLPKALHDLAGCDHLSEVVLVSTCQRTEAYAVAHKYHAAVNEIRNFMADWSGTPPEAFSSHLYEYHDEAAVRHLFKVAAGLDSAVLGEGEVLGQLGDAWHAAHGEGTAGPVLSILFRHSQEVGKRVRSETAIARGTTSLSQAAVALARAQLGTLEGRTTLVMGAGEMGEAMAQALAGSLEPGRLLVANRTWSRATALAARCGGRPIEWSTLLDALEEADVVLASTGSPEILLEASELTPALRRRDGRPLLIVDIAVPRDVDPAVAGLDGVTLLDMEEVSAFAERAMAGRRQEVPRAEVIIEAEVERYLGLATERQVAPLVGSLYERAEEIRRSELARFERRLGGLDDAQARAVEALTRGIVAKLLHDPTVAVKAGSGTVRGEQLASALRQLFDL